MGFTKQSDSRPLNTFAMDFSPGPCMKANQFGWPKFKTQGGGLDWNFRNHHPSELLRGDNTEGKSSSNGCEPERYTGEANDDRFVWVQYGVDEYTLQKESGVLDQLK